MSFIYGQYLVASLYMEQTLCGFDPGTAPIAPSLEDSDLDHSANSSRPKDQLGGQRGDAFLAE